jgi:hypothetical protein
MKIESFEHMLATIVRGRFVWLPYELVETMFPSDGVCGARSWAVSRGFRVEVDRASRRVGILRPETQGLAPILVR